MPTSTRQSGFGQLYFMKLIPLSAKRKCKNSGKYFAEVDDEDYDELIKYNWSATKMEDTFYAKRTYTLNGKRKSMLMHRQILGLTNKKIKIDHTNHNGICNVKTNIRIATARQNSMNVTKQKNCSSKYLGVRWHKVAKKWAAQIMVNGKSIWLGTFLVEEDAARARDVASLKYFGEFANLNFPN